MTTEAPRRPIMRYYGGKWMLAPWVIQHLPPHRRYFEPFGGVASVLMRKPRCHTEIYNDLNGRVVNVFRVLRDPALARELERLVRLTPYAREEYELACETSLDPVEDARRLVTMSFLGMSGAGVGSKRSPSFRRHSNERTGSSHAHDWTRWPDQIKAFTARLQGVTIESRDALALIPVYDTESMLFYVDPPYVPASRRDKSPGHGYQNELNEDGHRRLARILKEVRGMVVVSGYESELYNELYPDWHRVVRETHADGGRPAKEVLWMNAAAISAGGSTPQRS